MQLAPRLAGRERAAFPRWWRGAVSGVLQTGRRGGRGLSGGHSREALQPGAWWQEWGVMGSGPRGLVAEARSPGFVSSGRTLLGTSSSGGCSLPLDGHVAGRGDRRVDPAPASSLLGVYSPLLPPRAADWWVVCTEPGSPPGHRGQQPSPLTSSRPPWGMAPLPHCPHGEVGQVSFTPQACGYTWVRDCVTWGPRGALGESGTGSKQHFQICRTSGRGHLGQAPQKGAGAGPGSSRGSGATSCSQVSQASGLGPALSTG